MTMDNIVNSCRLGCQYCQLLTTGASILSIVIGCGVNIVNSHSLTARWACLLRLAVWACLYALELLRWVCDGGDWWEGVLAAIALGSGSVVRGAGCSRLWEGGDRRSRFRVCGARPHAERVRDLLL